MSWDPISETQLVTEGGLTSPELSAYTTLSLHGGVDPVPALIHNAVAQVRSAVGSSKIYNLGPDETVPTETRQSTISIIVWRIIVNLPITDKDLTEYRKKMFDDAWLYLKTIREGDTLIVPATTFSTQQLGFPSVQLVRPGNNQGIPASLWGLI